MLIKYKHANMLADAKQTLNWNQNRGYCQDRIAT